MLCCRKLLMVFLFGLLWWGTFAGDAQAAGFTASINFQKSNSASVPGYLPDVGYAFGLRTNSLWYGWNVENLTNAFERNLTADQRLDTGNKMQSGGQARYWQILVPDGIYDVLLVAGDPADTNGLVSGTRYNINVENSRAVIDAVPASDQWSFSLTKHLQVAVNDGLLTVTNGPGATNNSICFIEIRQVAPIYWGAAIIDNSNTHKSPNDYTSESNPGILGYYEGHTGKKISLLHWGNGSSSSLSGQTNYMAKMWARGTIPLYSWAPSTDSLTNIIAGKQDTYLSNWFACAKAYGKPFFLNCAREMNGTWYTWSEGNAINEGCPPGSFTNMWRHVHDLCVKKIGCTNITWIWVVDRDLVNSKHVGPISKFYPGDDYVDWLGMDLYNAGQIAPYNGEPFTTVYGSTYSNVVSLSPNKPIMICETATQDLSVTPKPAWIADALMQMPTAFPNIRGFTWFNWNDADVDKNWPIEGGDNLLPYTTAPVDWVSVNAFSNGVASPYYLPNIFANQANLTASPILPVTILDAPTNVILSPGDGSVVLSWSTAPGATNYGIYRCTSNNPLSRIARTSATSFTDTSVTNGTTYWYVIRAQNLAGESLSSTNNTGVTPQAPSPPSPLNAPSGLRAAAVSTNAIDLSWTDNSTNETGFVLEFAATVTNDLSLLATTGPNTTAFTDTQNLIPGTRRYYQVRSRNSGGTSLPSNIAGATTFATNATVAARRVFVPLLVDGNLSEPAWDLATPISKTILGTPNNNARFGVLWDATYLYVGVQVLDSALVNDSVSLWDDDSVDIYLDGAHNKLPTYDSNDRFFQKGWNDPALREAGGRINAVLHAAANLPGGYSVELAIPWTNFGLSAAADMTIGFDVANNDDDNGGGPDAQSIWAGSGNDYISTADFGDLYLSSKTARPEVDTTPTNIVAVITGSMLEISWPANHTGWQLQAQTNGLDTGLGTNWSSVPGSAFTNRVLTGMNPASGGVYYRLIWLFQ